MKRLLKKRVLIPLAIAVVVAIGAGVAYAAWTANASTPPVNVTTADPGLTIPAFTPWTLSNLSPGATYSETFWVQNTGTADFSGVTLTDALSNNWNDFGAYLNLAVSVNGTLYANTTVDGLASGLALGALSQSGQYYVTITLTVNDSVPQLYANGDFGNITFTVSGATS